MVVSHYGVHTDNDGVVHLLQQGQSGNFLGLPDHPPFKVTSDLKVGCPHSVRWKLGDTPDEEDWAHFQGALHTPMVREFLPLPKERGQGVVIFDNHPEVSNLLVVLPRLCSPNRELTFAISGISNLRLNYEMAVTNIAPLVLTGITPEHQMRVERIVAESLFLPRRLILVGHPTIVAAGLIKRKKALPEERWEGEVVEKSRLLKTLPLEELGAFVLQQYAWGEEIGSDIAGSQRLVNV